MLISEGQQIIQEVEAHQETLNTQIEPKIDANFTELPTPEVSIANTGNPASNPEEIRSSCHQTEPKLELAQQPVQVSPPTPKLIKRSKMTIKSNQFVIQKYIERPLLYERKKFDMRVFLLVTHDYKIYLCQELYIRLSAYNYDLADTRKFSHLTNIALQKYSLNYDEEKAIISPKQFEDFIKFDIDPLFDFQKDVFAKIHHICCILGAIIKRRFKTFCAHKKNFEIFGLDFMVDEELKVWFIEVNTNPAITLGNSFIDLLIPRMLDDAFKLTLDRNFPMPKLSDYYKAKRENAEKEGGQGEENGYENIKPICLNVEEFKEMERVYEESVFPLTNFKDSESVWKIISESQIEKALVSNPN